MKKVVDVRIDDNSSEILEEMISSRAVALEEIGLLAEGYAKQYCPVDTGRLRNSVSHSVNNNDGYVVIGTNVEYAPYVELGTSRQSAKPYLRPAVENHMNEYKNIADSKFRDKN